MEEILRDAYDAHEALPPSSSQQDVSSPRAIPTSPFQPQIVAPLEYDDPQSRTSMSSDGSYPLAMRYVTASQPSVIQSQRLVAPQPSKATLLSTASSHMSFPTTYGVGSAQSASVTSSAYVSQQQLAAGSQASIYASQSQMESLPFLPEPLAQQPVRSLH
jgi:hypothetical protein